MTSPYGFRLESARNPCGLQTPRARARSTLLNATQLQRKISGVARIHRRLSEGLALASMDGSLRSLQRGDGR